MIDRLEQIELRYREIEKQMMSPEVLADYQEIQKLSKEKSGIEDIVVMYRTYRSTVDSLESTKNMLEGESDDEMKDMVRQEIEELEVKQEQLLEDIKIALLPKNENDEKDIIIEIRAGVGGDEAGLFVADLYRMYTRYAMNRNWDVEVMDAHESGIGGFKEIVFEVRGKGAYSRFKYESGVHRVQRVPTTESSGRIHTSTVTVAVLPEVDEVEVDISNDDLRIDIFHSGGAGGQNVNKVATAVRITHLPTGIVVVCQDERSQLRNKTKALAHLRARLYDIEQQKQADEMIEQRRSQVGTGDRSEKIRTYNFPQDRVTDHRIGASLRNLPRVLDGEFDELIDSLATEDQARMLQGQSA